ncbi:cGMP-dependent protein kinase 1 [Uranotaenia lowii]|uniref:cGMP-dependent protein kinase 1 n=1 Tax=Uranotaenia lowii TaxID=190385 RepID=UPI002478E56D|nr:cGMP-dependent protein kinase 1 [Uranotaenia lowii]XP_055599698.1 cGMP-dependent protein kinase 1 [Uranotaenia lowii]XP_055599699.1 cGMP-dependent protein kinase 1 [Uranotaenia lowii]XP_055599700.1 cGMP-dependent protein kinase 1 [Uranotaenia lowii]
MACFTKFFSRKYGSFNLPDNGSQNGSIVPVRISTRAYQEEFPSNGALKNAERESGLGSLDERLNVAQGTGQWPQALPSVLPRKKPNKKSADQISQSSGEVERNLSRKLKESEQEKILLKLALESKIREFPSAEDSSKVKRLEKEIKELQNQISKHEAQIQVKEPVVVKKSTPQIAKIPPTITHKSPPSPKPADRSHYSELSMFNRNVSVLSNGYDTIPDIRDIPRHEILYDNEDDEETTISTDEDEPPDLPPRDNRLSKQPDGDGEDTSQDEEPTPPKLPPIRSHPAFTEVIGKPHVQTEKLYREPEKVPEPDYPPPARTPPPPPPPDLAECTNPSLRQQDSLESQLTPSTPTTPKIEELDGKMGILKTVRKEGVVSDKPEPRGSRDIVIPSYPKTEAEEALIKQAISANEFLNNMMDEDRVKAVMEAMSPMTFPPNSYIIKEGDIGAHFFVSAEGTYEVIVEKRVVKSFSSGVVFGELAILYKAKRFASIKTTNGAKVWMLERKVFQKIMMKSGRKEREENVKFLSTVSILKDLEIEKLYKISDLLKREFYATGSTIIQQGDPGDKFYIIRGGSVNVIKTDSNGMDKLVGSLPRGAYFGEQALLHEDRRLASIISNPPGTECLTLNRLAFNEFLGGLEQLREIKLSDEMPRPSGIYNKVSEFDHVQLHDLTYNGTLGIGGFGRVELVQYQDKKTFALKYLKKIEMVRQQQQEHAYSEKDIMLSCHSEFIVRLYKTYRDKKYLYFLMEACLGGDVWTVLQKCKYFEEKTARFMTGCVVLAFEYLHSRNIIYRDLKPENLMLDDQGYIKLVDFGFAKRIGANQKTWTFAGTPEYVSPEIILNKGHDRAVDYWALGVFIHELLVGKPPFRGKNHMKTYNAILRGIDIIEMPSRIPKKAQVLIKRLCRQAPVERLGYGKNGIADIKTHPWFSGFDWRKLQERTMVAPLVRPIQSDTDLSNFDDYPKDQDEPQDEMSGWDINF